MHVNEAWSVVKHAARDYANYLEERQECLTENLEHQEEIDTIDEALVALQSADLVWVCQTSANVILGVWSDLEDAKKTWPTEYKWCEGLKRWEGDYYGLVTITQEVVK